MYRPHWRCSGWLKYDTKTKIKKEATKLGYWGDTVDVIVVDH